MTNLFILNYYLTNSKNLRNYWLNRVTHSTNYSRSLNFFIISKKKNLKHLNNYSLTDYFNGRFYIYFLKKEIFYTKLKYSRVPQFDTSSGAAASFLSGMYGFMVSEKFGFELIDSADFLFLIIYCFCFVWAVITIHVYLNSDENIIKNLFNILKSFN